MWNCCIETKAPQRADVALPVVVSPVAITSRRQSTTVTLSWIDIVIGVLIGAAALGVGVALGVAVALVLHHAFG
jgi:hypothetical protein